MSIFGAFDKTKHLSELADPLVTNAGVITPAVRKQTARANLGTFAASDGVMDARFGEQPLVSYGAPPTLNVTGTLTATLMMAGAVTSTTAAAVSATADTGSNLETALVAAYPQLAVNDTFQFAVINTGGNTFTILTATGWTLVGNMVVAAGTSGAFRVRRTATNVFVMYRLA